MRHKRTSPPQHMPRPLLSAWRAFCPSLTPCPLPHLSMRSWYASTLRVSAIMPWLQLVWRLLPQYPQLPPCSP